MPTYEFYCEKCNAIDEVVRSVKDSGQAYDCPECNLRTVRRYNTPNVSIEVDQTPYLHPAFGTMMTDKQAREEAKRRGYVEVGNDTQERVAPPRLKSYD